MNPTFSVTNPYLDLSNRQLLGVSPAALDQEVSTFAPLDGTAGTAGARGVETLSPGPAVRSLSDHRLTK